MRVNRIDDRAASIAMKTTADLTAVGSHALAEFRAAHPDVGPNVRVAASALDSAADAVFALTGMALPTALAAEDPRFSDDYIDEQISKVRTDYVDQIGPGIEEFDRALERLVARVRSDALPKLPAGSDERLLREEALLVLQGSAGSPFDRLAALARSPRRDLAALAVSPWASTWAGTQGLDEQALAGVQSIAVEASAQYGSKQEAAAAKAFGDAVGLISIRGSLAASADFTLKALGEPRGFGSGFRYHPGDVDLVAVVKGAAIEAPPIMTITS